MEAMNVLDKLCGMTELHRSLLEVVLHAIGQHINVDSMFGIKSDRIFHSSPRRKVKCFLKI